MRLGQLIEKWLLFLGVLFGIFAFYVQYIIAAGAKGNEIYKLYPLTNNNAENDFPSWSPDGNKIAYYSNKSGNGDIWIKNADGSGEEIPFIATPSFESQLVWSPDGRHIAYFSTNENRRGDIYVALGKDVYRTTRLYKEKDWTEYPAWSYDGDKIAFFSGRDGGLDIWVKDLKANVLKRITNHPAFDFAPAWSPDGRYIAFSSLRTGNMDIWMVSIETGELVQITNHPAFDFAPAWSPDGRYIAFSSNRSGNDDIWIADIRDNNKTYQITFDKGKDYKPVFSPEGKRLAFVSTRNGKKGNIWVLEMDGGLWR